MFGCNMMAKMIPRMMAAVATFTADGIVLLLIFLAGMGFSSRES
jgi:hypothetical protein